MATNGNFSSGNSGFLTAYTYNATSIVPTGTYAIGPNPSAVHPSFGSWGDHTSGTGNYMLVNGSTVGNTILWRQIVSFPPGVQVTVKWWMLTFATPPASLQLKLAGSNIGNPVSTPNSTGSWSQAVRTFTVPSSGSATINLVTLSSAATGTISELMIFLSTTYVSLMIRFGFHLDVIRRYFWILPCSLIVIACALPWIIH